MVCAHVRRVIDRTGAQSMHYLTCTIITSVDLAHYGVSRAKDWVSVDCGTKTFSKTYYNSCTLKNLIGSIKSINDRHRQNVSGMTRL